MSNGVLCARCKLRPAHRRFDSGRGLCGDCYAVDPTEPPAAVRHGMVAAKEPAPRAPSPAASGAGERAPAGKRREDAEGQAARLSYEGGERHCPKHGAVLVVRAADAAQPEGRQVLRCPWQGCATVEVAPGEELAAQPALSGAARDARNHAARRRAIAAANPKREAILADARTGRFSCASLAKKHGLTYQTVYFMCSAAKVKLPRARSMQAVRSPAADSVQARARAGTAGTEGSALVGTARAVRPVRNFDPRAFEGAVGGNGGGTGLTIPFTPAVSLALWRGLPLEAQHAILREVLQQVEWEAPARE